MPLPSVIRFGGSGCCCCMGVSTDLCLAATLFWAHDGPIGAWKTWRATQPEVALGNGAMFTPSGYICNAGTAALWIESSLLPMRVETLLVCVSLASLGISFLTWCANATLKRVFDNIWCALPLWSWPSPEELLEKLLLPFIGLNSSTIAVALEVQERNNDSTILQCQVMEIACQTPKIVVRNQTVATRHVLMFTVDHLLQENESLVDVMI